MQMFKVRDAQGQNTQNVSLGCERELIAGMPETANTHASLVSPWNPGLERHNQTGGS